ncbi:MAG: type IV pilus assembly protein PilM [Candidatus Zixiibacteriota bacterium]
MFAGRKKSTVGLDIGANTVKLVKLDHIKTGYIVSGMGMRELPSEAIVSDEVRDRDAVIFNIQALIDQVDPKIRDVHVSVSGHGVITDKFTIDRKTGAEAEQAIIFETEQRAPFDIDDVTLDYHVSQTHEEENKMDVLMVAARNEFLDGYLELVQECDLRPTMVDIDAFAALNAYEFNYDIDPERTTAIVNVGHDVTNICYLLDGKLHSTRDVSAGVREIFNSIQKEFRLNLELATKAIKGELGDSVDQDMLKATIVTASDELIAGIEQAFTYFKSQSKAPQIDWIVLSGGGALVPYLAEHLQAKLAIPIEMLNPLRGIEYDPQMFEYLQPEKIAPMLAVPIGLALRRAKKKK